jgi:hypothetical protein
MSDAMVPAWDSSRLIVGSDIDEVSVGRADPIARGARVARIGTSEAICPS